MLKQRIITALILAPIAIGGFFFLSPFYFAWFTGLIIALGAWEWANLAGFEQPLPRWGYAAGVGLALGLSTLVSPLLWLGLALAVWAVAFVMIRSYPQGVALWGDPWRRLVLGLLVLIPAWAGLNVLRTWTLDLGALNNNALLLLYVFCIVWAADVGAYFAGRAFGRAKLAPNVSPGKSWAGVYGGLASVALLAAGVAWFSSISLGVAILLVVASLVTAMVSVIGDLFESMLKRHRGIKDSSQLLPGHGGILDRIDSLTAALPVFAVLAVLCGWLSAPI